jgi:hypothetical protein
MPRLLVPVPLVVQAALNRRRSQQVMLVSLLVPLLLVHRALNRHQALLKCNNMPPMPKVSSKTPTHKSFDEQRLAVCKPTLKTSKFASCNHHRCHLQA